jgi:hypothetical protein
VRPEGLGNFIKIIHLIGSRTRDLSVCNLAPLPLCYRVSQLINIIFNNFYILRYITDSNGLTSTREAARFAVAEELPGSS